MQAQEAHNSGHMVPISVHEVPAAQNLDGKSHKFDLQEAIKLKLVNKLSFRELARHYNVPPSTIHQRFKSLIKIIADPELNEAYAANRVPLLNGVERVLMGHLTDADKLKNASLNNVAYAFQQVHQARRLEENLSTSNEATVEVRLRAIYEQRRIAKRGIESDSQAVDITNNSNKV